MKPLHLHAVAFQSVHCVHQVISLGHSVARMQKLWGSQLLTQKLPKKKGKDSAAISNKQFMLFLLVTIFVVGLETYIGNVNWLLSARTSPKLISPHLSPSREGRHP